MKKLVAVILTFLLVLTGCSSVKVTKVEDDIKTDGIKFREEYKKVSKDNIYEYATYGNVIDVLEEETGIIYMGFPTCALCQEITPILDDVAKNKKIKSILYYNFKEIRSNNTEEYKKLVDILNDYIKTDEEGSKRLTAPTIIFINKGNIVGVYIGTISADQEEIITDEEKENLKNNFSSLIDKMFIKQETTTESIQ